MTRELTFAEAIWEATDMCLANDPAVYVMGLGVTDSGGVFGTTVGLQERHGSDRVVEMPTSENGMTGVAIGSAMAGMRPIMTHQRVEFALLAVEQIVNHAAKASYVSGCSIPLVIRLIVGRGWGQGPQHSQSLHSWFAHIPGIKVIMPVTPHDAKGLLLAAVEDNGPVLSFEHRWLHGIKGGVPEGRYEVPLGSANVVREGRDVTLVATSYMVLESMRAAQLLERNGVSVEIIDLRTIKPLDTRLILSSLEKTGRLVVADTGWEFAGVSAEILALVASQAFDDLVAAPRRLALPDVPTPASPTLIRGYYPRAIDIANQIISLLGCDKIKTFFDSEDREAPVDQPDTGIIKSF